MEGGGNRPPRSRAAAVAELEALENDRAVLWAELENEDDPGSRALVLSQLSDNRSAIARVRDELDLDNPETPEVHTSRSFVVDTADHTFGGELSRFAPPTGQPRFEPEPELTGPAPLTHGEHVDSMAAPQSRPQRPSGPRPARRNEPVRDNAGLARWVLLFVGGALAALAVVWFLTSNPFSDDPETATDASSEDGNIADPASAEAKAAEISMVLQGMGMSNVQVAAREGTIFVSGTAADAPTWTSAIGAAQALAGEIPLDTAGFVVQTAAAPNAGGTAPEGSAGRPDALQTEINRIVAATPIIFESGSISVTELHSRILNNVAATMLAYPGLAVTIVGFTDDTGSPEANRQVSLGRAENVKTYLLSQGVPDANLDIDAQGEDGASGSVGLQGLERRVEFRVVSTAQVPGAGGGASIRVAIIAPSARNDLAFTQSMVDAVNTLNAQRGGIEIDITDNTFVPEEAAAAIRGYADQGYDLILAHGSQFGAGILEIAPQYPDVAFAWGTAADTFDLPNVYAYDSATEEGGYLQGVMAALVSSSNIIGIVSPIEVGDAQRYVAGFEAGVTAQSPNTQVLTTFTGSFSDIALASETAEAHVAAGADVMTGSAQMVVGAINVANENDVRWFGSQSNQTLLAPNVVTASMVYHWEVILSQIIADVDAGNLGGKSFTANLANGGIVIEYNSELPVPDDVRQRVDALTQEIINGTIVPPQER